MIFLIGGAALSAVRYARKTATRDRATGNALIALGALLPGIGGGLAKFGFIEGLYVGEFLGIILIWIGYVCCVRQPVAPGVITGVTGRWDTVIQPEPQPEPVRTG